MTPLLGVETKAGSFLVSTSDRVVGRKLFVNRARGEMGVLRAVLGLLEAAGIDPRAGDAAFVDVGANIGTTLVPALRRHGFAHGIAFEPAPENFRLLSLNLALNDLDGRVRAHELAVSDREGTATLTLDPANSGNHRLGGGGDDGEHVTVRLTSLDALAAAGELDVAAAGLLWIDAQGHEPSVLGGASRLLEAGVPVVLELWPAGLAEAGSLERLRDILAASFTHVAELGRRRELVAVDELDAVIESCGTAITDLLAVRL